MPSYNDARRILGLDPAADFSDITSDLVEQKDLSFAYDDVEDLDLWAGLLAEDEVGGSMVGELLRIILTEQFERLRSGDRFWYERTLGSRLQRKVERQTLARVIRRNTPVAGEIQDDVFRLP